MSNKASLTNAELEVTQKIQTHFPRELRSEVIANANSCPAENLTAAIEEMLIKLADGAISHNARILRYIRSFKAPAVEKFVAADHFETGDIVDGVKILSMNYDFVRCFLAKTEVDVPEVTIRVHNLTILSRDSGIRSEIGPSNEEIKLAHFWESLKRNDSVKSGFCILAYIVDIDSKLWAVCALRVNDGWEMHANSVVDRDPWRSGVRILSR